MKILIIDTSTEKGIIVFAEHGVPILTLTLPGLKSSKLLFPSILSGMNTLQWKVEDFEAVAVGVGPGSFTGIRVGVSAAKGIAQPKSLPLIGFCSLSGFVSQSEGQFLSVIDAKMGEAYVLKMERKEGKIYELGAPQIVPKETLSSWGYEMVGPSFSELNLAGNTAFPDSPHLARLTFEKIKTKANDALKIIYLRDSHYSGHL